MMTFLKENNFVITNCMWNHVAIHIIAMLEAIEARISATKDDKKIPETVMNGRSKERTARIIFSLIFSLIVTPNFLYFIITVYYS